MSSLSTSTERHRSIRVTSSPTRPRPTGTPMATSPSGVAARGHFEVQSETAKILGIPDSRVKVVPMEIGGGFGGKTLVYLEPVAALLSKKTGRAVKLTMNRSEVFEGTGPTSGGWLKVKMGAKSAGQNHGCGSLPGLRSRRLSRFPGGLGRSEYLRVFTTSPTRGSRGTMWC